MSVLLWYNAFTPLKNETVGGGVKEESTSWYVPLGMGQIGKIDGESFWKETPLN